MNKIVLGFMLSMVAAGAGAQAPADTEVSNDGAMPATEAAADKVVIAADASDASKKGRRCVSETGTRIKQREADRCLSVNGTSYNRDDIDSTGAVEIGDALQRLDPSISVHH